MRKMPSEDSLGFVKGGEHSFESDVKCSLLPPTWNSSGFFHHTRRLLIASRRRAF